MPPSVSPRRCKLRFRAGDALPRPTSTPSLGEAEFPQQVFNRHDSIRRKVGLASFYRCMQGGLIDQVVPVGRLRQLIDQLVRFLLEDGGHGAHQLATQGVL